MGFVQYPPISQGGGGGALTSTAPITGNPPNLDTLGEMALAINSANSNIGALSTQVGSLATAVSTLPPSADIMLRSEYDTDANNIVDTADTVNGGFI